jgi:MFS family permease
VVTYRQHAVPDELRGRVNSVYRMIGWGLIPAGAIIGGLAADSLGLRAPFILGGIIRAIALIAALPVLVYRRPHSRPLGVADAPVLPRSAP